MKKVTLLLAAAALLLGNANAQDYKINKHVANYPYEQNITVDGQYWTDPFWTGIISPPRVNGANKISIPSSDNNFDFAATYDNANLYVVVLVHETYGNNQTPTWFQDDSSPSTPWDDDAVEIFIDPKNGHPLFQAIVSHKADYAAPRELWVNSNYTKDGIQYGTSFQTGTKYISGYQVEVVIPWSKLGITPGVGLNFALDIAVDDDDNGGARDGQVVWKGNANNYNNSSAYGNVTLFAVDYGVGYANYIAGLPVIDGEVIYDPGFGFPVSDITKQVIGTSDNQANIRLTYDPNYLYVGVVVWDYQGYTNTIYSDSPELWNDDAVDIFIDPLNTKLPYFDSNLHRQITVRNSTAGVPPSVSIRGNSAGILYASKRINAKIFVGGYSVEVAIPWSNLGISPLLGTYVGFDVAVNDDDNGGTRDSQLAWKGTINDYQNASVWGTILLNQYGFSGQPYGARETSVSLDETAVADVTAVASVYPNPVQDQLTIQVGLPASSIKIVDVQGRLVHEQHVEGLSSYSLETSAFEDGLYFVTVLHLDGKTETLKVLK